MMSLPDFRFYYQYSSERLAVCKLTLHALLHVPADVRRCRPVWTSWSFLIERYCGLAVDSVKSKVNPYVSISNRVLQMTQLSALTSQYRSVKEALKDMGPNPTLSDISTMEHTYIECEYSHEKSSYPLISLPFRSLHYTSVPLSSRVLSKRLAETKNGRIFYFTI